MTNSLRRGGIGLGLFCAVTGLYAAPAFAEDPSATETAAARSLAVDGLKLAQSGDCAGAIPKLERAEKLHHAPVVASRLGECYVSSGRLVEGTEILRKVLREPAPADATPAYSKALERAQRAFDIAKPRIAGLTVKVAAVQDMRIVIDGNPVAGALVDAEIPADPGEHSIEVSAPGFLKSGTHVRVGDGEKKTVTLTLTRDPAAAAAPAAPAAAPVANTAVNEPAPPSPTDAHVTEPAPSAAPSRRTPNHVAAYVSLTLGTAGLATGGVLGLMAMKRYKTLQQSCPGNVCPPEKQEALSSAKQLGNFSNIAFGVGATGIVLGTVLYFTVGGGEADHASASSRRFAGISRPGVAVGPGQIELSGEF